MRSTTFKKSDDPAELSFANFSASSKLRTVRVYNTGDRNAYGAMFTPLDEIRSSPRFRTLLQKIRKSPTFLDVGCGFGNMLYLAKRVNPKIQACGIELRHQESRAASKYGQVWRLDAFDFARYGEFDTIYTYRPLVRYEHQLELEGLIIEQMRKGATLISLLPAHHLLLANKVDKPSGVFTKN